MLWEVWQHWRTPSAPYLKQMGYVYEAIAMQARAARCRYTWFQHYQRCQQTIKVLGEQCESRRKILILGAGSTQDIPLAYLNETFEQVVLVDLVFTRNVLKQVQAFERVECVLADVTDSVEGFYHGVLHLNTPQGWLDDDEVDLVVSLNMATQLPLLPVRWLLDHFSLSEAQIEHIGQGLMRQHLDYLARFNARVCLIADRVNREFNREGELVEHLDPWWGLTPPPALTQWDWQVIPFGEGKRRGVRQVNQVGVSIKPMQQSRWLSETDNQAWLSALND
ncbi:MAG: hypothetical protein RBS36_00515 [Thiomicrospira sp.]|jgi:hypothetical protein|nr:hypothetical protein [Thiomicrospira sp.]